MKLLKKFDPLTCLGRDKSGPYRGLDEEMVPGLFGQSSSSVPLVRYCLDIIAVEGILYGTRLAGGLALAASTKKFYVKVET